MSHGPSKCDKVTDKGACQLPSQCVSKWGEGAYKVLKVAEGLSHVHLFPFATLVPEKHDNQKGWDGLPTRTPPRPPSLSLPLALL
jgi:hypothetical protein